MLDVVLKISVYLSVLTYPRATQGVDGFECDKVNGTYRTFGISKGKPTVEKLDNKVVYIDQPVHFQCELKANPEARIFWLYNGTFIKGTGFQNQYQYGKCNETLSITYSVLEDSGSYACLVRNIYGEASANATLEVKIPVKTESTQQIANTMENGDINTTEVVQIKTRSPLGKNNSAFSVAHCGIFCYGTSGLLATVAHLFLYQ